MLAFKSGRQSLFFGFRKLRGANGCSKGGVATAAMSSKIHNSPVLNGSNGEAGGKAQGNAHMLTKKKSQYVPVCSLTSSLLVLQVLEGLELNDTRVYEPQILSCPPACCFAPKAARLVYHSAWLKDLLGPVTREKKKQKKKQAASVWVDPEQHRLWTTS